MTASYRTLKAVITMKIAGFIFKKHSNPALKFIACAAVWANRKRYGSGTLAFLEHEESIDIMDDRDYE